MERISAGRYLKSFAHHRGFERLLFNILSSVDHSAEQRFIPDKFGVFFDVCGRACILGDAGEVGNAAIVLSLLRPLEFFGNEMDIGRFVLKEAPFQNIET